MEVFVKKVLWMVTLVLIMALAVNAQDAEKKVNLYLGAGAGLPMGDFGDAYGTGLHGMGAVGFKVAPTFQIRGKVEFHTFGMDEAFRNSLAEFFGTGTVSNVDGGGANFIMFGGDAKYNFPMENSKFSPYLVGGLGMAAISAKDITFTDDDGSQTLETESETKVYFEVGAGFEIASGEAMSFFVQGRYVSVSTEGSSSSFLPFTVGLRF
jgi:opacity protein-like surface antigen